MNFDTSPRSCSLFNYKTKQYDCLELRLLFVKVTFQLSENYITSYSLNNAWKKRKSFLWSYKYVTRIAFIRSFPKLALISAYWGIAFESNIQFIFTRYIGAASCKIVIYQSRICKNERWSNDYKANKSFSLTTHCNILLESIILTIYRNSNWYSQSLIIYPKSKENI